MKHIFILSLLFFTTLLTAQPETQPAGIKLTMAVEPSSMILSKFAYDNPNTRAIWTKEDNNIYAAMYRDENTNLNKITRYDINGNVLSHANELKNNNYPLTISKYLAKKFPGEESSVWSYETEGKKTFYVTRGDDVLWFNALGKYSKTITKDGNAITKP